MNSPIQITTATRKTRPQPSLAPLTVDEYHQLADMVCTRTYEDVRQQINKSRSEGGFDLNISVKPLQVLHARVRRLHKINAQFAAGKKLTLTAYDEIHAGEHRAPEEVNEAIMSATYALVTEHDNTPHQLLALQRLADFPARAEIRAAKEQHAEAKALRDAEMHTHKTTLELRKEAHKVQMDLRKFEHKLEMDTFHQHIATERLNLKKQTLAFRIESSPSPLRGDHNSRSERLIGGNSSVAGLGSHWVGVRGSPTSTSDQPSAGDMTYTQHHGRGTFHPCPTSTSRDAMNDTHAAPADPNAADIQNSSAPATPVNPANPVNHVQKPLSEAEIDALIPHVISPRPLPPEVIRANIIYAEKVRTGKIIIDRSGPWVRAIELPAPNAAPSSNGGTNSTSPTSTSPRALDPSPCNADNLSARLPAATAPIHAAPADLTSTDVPTSASDPKSEISNQKPEINETPSVPETQNSELTIQNSASAEAVAEAVDTYTISRVREYIAHSQKYTPWPHRHSPPEYITQFRHCPCGRANPCPTHESEEFGPFPNIFWKISPFAPAYAACLRDRNLPYREPKEYLP